MPLDSRHGLLIALTLAASAVPALSLDALASWLSSKKTVCDTLEVLPYFLVGATAFLGQRMNYLSIVFSSLFIGSAYWIVSGPPSGWGEGAAVRSLSVAAPFSLALVFRSPPGRLFSLRGALALALAGLPLATFLGLCRADLPWLRAGLMHPWLPDYFGWRLPGLSLVLTAGFAATLPWLRDAELRRFATSALFALLPFFHYLNLAAMPVSLSHQGLRAGLAFSIVGAVLLHAIYRVYWQKVYIDELTELPNRRALENHMMVLSKRYVIAMVDIDHFKRFNDTYGHAEGDNVLRFVGFQLSRHSGLRTYRYGGEEFCVIFEKADPESARAAIERAREAIASRDFFIRSPKHVREKTSKRDRRPSPEGTPKVKITISAGLAAPGGEARSPEEVRRAADAALYEAKSHGRNQVRVALGGPDRIRA